MIWSCQSFLLTFCSACSGLPSFLPPTITFLCVQISLHALITSWLSLVPRRTPIHPLKPSEKIPYFRKHSLTLSILPTIANPSFHYCSHACQRWHLSLPCLSSRTQSAVSPRFRPLLSIKDLQHPPTRAADGPRKTALLP